MVDTKLEEARRKIQDIDREIAELFEQRMQAVREIAAFKKEHGIEVADMAQERRVLSRNAAYIQDEQLKPYYLTFMRDIMNVSKQFQEQLMKGKEQDSRGSGTK